MKIKAYILFAVTVLMNVSVNSLSLKNLEYLMSSADIHWISFEQYKTSFAGKSPQKIGMDVDHTLFDNDAVNQKLRRMYGAEEDPNNTIFHDKYNCEMVDIAWTKEIAKKIIAFHVERRDELFFITARYSSPCIERGEFSLDDLIRREFNLKTSNKVIYVGDFITKTPKTKKIEQLGLSVFIGDGDSDINSALAANVRAIRVMQPSNIGSHTPNNIGQFGEEVLINSHY